MAKIFFVTMVIMFFITGCAEDMHSPVVEIVQPVDGDTVFGSVEILAEADDDLGVEKVEIYINDTLRAEIAVEPYSYTWNTLTLPENSVHHLRARAYDAADNEGISSVVMVIVHNMWTCNQRRFTYEEVLTMSVQ